MSPILPGGSDENRDESGCRRPVEENVCKAMYNKHALKAYDDCYHRAIQRTLIRGIRHIEGDDIGDGFTEGEVRADTGSSAWLQISCCKVVLVLPQSFIQL